MSQEPTVRRIVPGVYLLYGEGVIHIHPVEALDSRGYPNTSRSRREAEDYLREAAETSFEGYAVETIWPEDLE